MIKVSEPPPSEAPKQSSESSEGKAVAQVPKVEPAKEMDDNTAKQTMQKLKQKQNVKAISSEDFKDNSMKYDG